MAEYYTQAVVMPEIPFDLLDDDTLTRLDLCGFTYELTPTGWYLYADEYLDEFEDVLQEIVRRSEGQLQYLSVEGSYSCSEPFPDAYGGFAYVITADNLEYISTGLWLQDHIPWQEETNQPPDSIQVETYCTPLLNQWRMELRFGQDMQVLDLEEAGQLADAIRKQLTIHQIQAEQQTTLVEAQEIMDQPMLW